MKSMGHIYLFDDNVPDRMNHLEIYCPYELHSDGLSGKLKPVEQSLPQFEYFEVRAFLNMQISKYSF